MRSSAVKLGEEQLPPSFQNFAAVLLTDVSGKILAATENLRNVLRRSDEGLATQPIEGIIGVGVWENALSRAADPSFATTRSLIGQFQANGRLVRVCASCQVDHILFELEQFVPDDQADEQLPTASALIKTLRNDQFVPELLAQAVETLSALTGFERVMAVQFDPSFNGDVIAETVIGDLQRFEGLRFPHWDLSPNGRTRMRRVPLRVIADIEAPDVGLKQLRRHTADVDISWIRSRGASDITKRYLRSLNARASITLSLVVNGALWGMIVFHDRQPKRLSCAVLTLLEEVQCLLSLKLETRVQDNMLRLNKQIEAISASILDDVAERQELAHAYEAIGPILMNAFDASGVAFRVGSEVHQYGETPKQPILDLLFQRGESKPNQVVPIDNLADKYPEDLRQLNGSAGALVISTVRNQTVLLFRGNAQTQIRWAGNPFEQLVDGEPPAKPTPRLSYAAYLEDKIGHCDLWTQQELLLAQRLGPIVNTAERQVLANQLNRQQSLTIDELNHRVRNILALVRAVSQQSRSEHDTVTTFAAAVEARIEALAAAHKVGQSSEGQLQAIHDIIRAVTAPYAEPDQARIHISGPNRGIISEQSPILGLIAHELTTNAVKYGALSAPLGTVNIRTEKQTDGLLLIWEERGGPTIKKPESMGFGVTLIEEAVPHSFRGRTVLNFDPEGLRAEIFLPNGYLTDDVIPSQVLMTKTPRPATPPTIAPTDERILVVEDNILIGFDMQSMLKRFGIRHIDVTTNVQDALKSIDTFEPTIAILDVNLGNGSSSMPIAQKLHDLSVPFALATGYSDPFAFQDTFSKAPKLTKPISEKALRQVLGQIRSGGVTGD